MTCTYGIIMNPVNRSKGYPVMVIALSFFKTPSNGNMHCALKNTNDSLWSLLCIIGMVSCFPLI